MTTREHTTRGDTPEDRSGSTTAMKRAYLTMERMQRRIDEHERARTEPIAIVGVGCRFPGGVTDPDSYWELLTAGTDTIGAIPADRWDVEAFYDERPRTPGKHSTRWGGFLDHIDRFDHEFFGISRREAVSMDPQQRLVLEVAWEALEDAGQAPDALAGSRTGVFLGICSNDYAGLLFREPQDITAHASTGVAHSIASGRLSYLLDLRGPSVSVDTACSSSLVAVHQACQNLRLGECDLAMAGGVNAVVAPDAAISFSQFPEMLADDGRCKTFDAAANGFVRSEGCGVVVLKRLSDARRDGDRVLAVIRGSAVNQDGRSSGLTAPNGAAQREVFRRALAAAGVGPDRVGYIETHGAGTKLGDPIEVSALAEVYGRAEGAPLHLGAVKTNLGHLEAAAGIAGLIKAALCVDRGQIPPNLHFAELNPHISFEGTTFAVPTALTPWPAEAGSGSGGARRLAGVSSFGFSGTNAHLIVEQAPDAPAVPPGGGTDAGAGAGTADGPGEDRPLSVLALSARSGGALLKLARRYQDRLAKAGPADAADLCFSANTGRSHFPHRLAAVGATPGELAERLADFVRDDPGEGLLLGRSGGTPAGSGPAAEPVFLFTGQGPQRAGMARRLYETQPFFRRTLDRCDEILRDVLPAPLLAAVYPDSAADGELINTMEFAQPGLFAVEYALAGLWRSWGVEPAAVIGHSLGEYAAACFAGALSLEDGLRLVAERGRLLQRLAESGAMAAIAAPAAEVTAELARHDEALVAVAAVNGPANTTVSGVREVVDEVCAAFAARGAEVRRLRISTSSHSPLVEPVLEPLRAALEKVPFGAPAVPLLSNLTGGLWPWDKPLDTDYWLRHARQPVLFADGVRALYELGHRTFLEVGPAPTLLGLVGEVLTGDDVLMLPSLRPKYDDWEVLLGSLGQLYAEGAEVDWAGFDREYRRARTSLPHYPFAATRCWHEPSGDGSAAAPVRRPAERAERAERVPRTERPARTERAARAERTERPSSARTAPARRLTGAPGRAAASALPTSAELLAAPAEQRVETLVAGLTASVRAALGSRAAAVDADAPLSTLGLDSLMAVELRNEIQGRLGVKVTVAEFLKGATVRSLAGQVVEGLAAAGPAATATGEAAPIRRAARSTDHAPAPGAVTAPDPTAELLALLEQVTGESERIDD
ncbi:Acyl transferase domain-containing protein [Streptomyces sp. TLI_053]|uniref:type I polyketide synthase n=1 Tax=Streptomyces sp. TLI_053 TaxID=1855352 RepID=UPI00087BACD0|nr:type I polyketide synthase [Streptomyces sp. TLI_053]SDT82754.1 Acyl transferase domain-containing protein [Streptomyces sp. TLI_053]